MATPGKEKKFLPLGEISVPIYYEDTDFTGYVFHANFLKYFDRAREESLGMKLLKDLYDQSIHFVVRNADLSYRRPVQHGNVLRIVSFVSYSGSPLLLFKQEARLIKEKEDEEVAVSALIQLVSVNAKGTPCRLPKQVSELLNLRSKHFL